MANLNAHLLQGHHAVDFAHSDAKYIVQELSSDLSAEQSLGALATGILKNTTTTGVGILSIAVAGADYEAALGNPGVTGYVLSSTDAGVRSWIAAGGALAFADLTDYPADAAGVLTNDGAGALSWAAGGGALALDDLTDVDAITGLADQDVLTWDAGTSLWIAKTPSAGGGGTIWSPDAFPASPTAQSDHFADASINGKWVDFNVTAGTSFAESGHFIKVTKSSNEGNKYRGKYQTLPAGDFTITMKFGMITAPLSYHQFGFILFEDAAANPTTCDMEMWALWTSAGTPSISTGIQYWPTYTAWGAGDANGPTLWGAHGLYWRIRQNGNTWYFDHSADGLSWQTIYSRAARFTPKEFGFGLCNNTATTEYVWIDWIYYEAADNIFPLGG